MKENNLGAKIKEIRMKKLMTQAELAAGLHVTPGFISNIEKGRTSMSLNMLIEMSRFVGESLDSFAGLIDPEYRETALNNEILMTLSSLDVETKEKLLRTLKIWTA